MPKLGAPQVAHRTGVICHDSICVWDPVCLIVTAILVDYVMYKAVKCWRGANAWFC